MIPPKLTWYGVEKDELPSLAFGAPVSGKRKSSSDPFDSHARNVAAAVGFAWSSTESLDYQPPAVFVFRKDGLAETLSWLRVYARDSFPLSQFARVLSADDWKMMASDDGIGRSFRDDRWASLILGELLAQTEQGVSLDSVPISRAQACFSTPVARAHKFYDSYFATRTCTERLRSIESDSRFMRRGISVDALVPIWSLASTSFGKISSAREIAEFVSSAASSFTSHSMEDNRSGPTSFDDAIFSDSIEERVVEFQRMADAASVLVEKTGSLSTALAARIGAAAFLVGRGTSHAFMILKYPRIAPLAQVWFGLIAGIAGAEYWDPQWAKALKSVEKHVRAAFSWSDPPMSDISWLEYNWVVSVVRGAQAFSGIAKQAQTSLSIEVLPGVSCQLRLNSEGVNTQVRPSPKSLVNQGRVVEPLSPEVVLALTQMVQVSDKAKEILSLNKRLPSLPVAESSHDLFKEGSAPSKRASRKPKGK